MAVQWRGDFPAATTQFHQDQAIDIKATLAHLDTMIDAGIHGLIMLGTVGENCSLEYAEKLELLKATVAHLGGRVARLERRRGVHHGPGVPVRARCPARRGPGADGAAGD